MYADGQQLSYAELVRRPVGWLPPCRAAGVGPGRGGRLCARRSLELVVGLLGILKAGAAYLPLDPDLPGDRLGSRSPMPSWQWCSTRTASIRSSGLGCRPADRWAKDQAQP